MRVKSMQDLATGLLFLLIGVGAFYIGSTYSMGVAQRPGTGVLPRILAFCMMGTGTLLLIKSVLTEGPRLEGFAWRPLAMVTLAAVAFSLLIDRAGLIVTMVVSLTIAALGTPETRWREFALFIVMMVVMALGIFIYGLGMPLKVLPWN
jgi:hypothetical protein